MEGDAGEYEAEDHAWGRPDHDLPPANDVDVFEREEGEDEVGAGHNESDGGGLVETNLLEESRCKWLSIGLKSTRVHCSPL